MTHPALSSGSTAVITGSASGIGLATAVQFAKMGLNVVIADIGAERLAEAAKTVADASPNGADSVMAHETDVSKMDDLIALEAAVQQRFGGTDILMNNAAVQPGSDMLNKSQTWQRILDVNLHGVINGCHVFAPNMLKRNGPCLIINTGSKQGITTPPGDPAYNVAKSGVISFTEALQHEFRNIDGANISAHLLIPGFVYTPLSCPGRTELPDDAWLPEQITEFMIASLEKGDFYILCPDNDVKRPLDELRMRWAADDIIKNRPPLSRWHPDYADAYADFIKDI